MEIFQALHGEVQHSSELFLAFCPLLSIALDGLSDSKKARTGSVIILLALAETYRKDRCCSTFLARCEGLLLLV
jgi:hypothetical protein